MKKRFERAALFGGQEARGGCTIVSLGGGDGVPWYQATLPIIVWEKRERWRFKGRGKVAEARGRKESWR